MNWPGGRPLTLNEGILLEPGPADGRIVLWLPIEGAGGYRHWERVGSVPRAEVTTGLGVCSVPATSVPARQRPGGSLGGLFRWPRGGGCEGTLTHPGGGEAEPCGPRRADLMLAWSEDKAAPLDLGRVLARWPDCEKARAIGAGLYLVSGVGAARPQASSDDPQGPGATVADSPRGRAERALAEARESGDPRRCSIALADLGLACLQGRDTLRGVGLMEEAVAEARRADDPGQEARAMIDLGVAELSSGRPVRAREALGAALGLSRAAGDRFAERAALERLGQAHAASGDHANALAHFEKALALAVALGDGPGQAELSWHVALQHAELGRRDRAIVLAQAAVDRMRRLGRPQARWYAHHLALFRSGEAGMSPPGSGATRGDPRGDGPGMIVATHPTRATPAPPGPGALRMAVTAIGSMAKFLGSGFQASPAETYRDRLEACAACEHHTGLRCRLCGCFTAAKARLLHERCPTSRWPS